MPIRPAELAREARGAVAAGAFAVHVHPRDDDGGESLKATDVSRALAAIRDACPAVPVGVTTGAWIVPDPAERIAQVRTWSALPDFASVNFHEAGAAELAELLLGQGIGVEAGVSNPVAATTLVASGLASRCLRVLLEPMEERLDDALGNLGAIESALVAGGVAAPRLLHGMGAPVWELIRLAAERGYDTRAGLEDSFTLPDGGEAPDNAALVAAAVAVVSAVARAALR